MAGSPFLEVGVLLSATVLCWLDEFDAFRVGSLTALSDLPDASLADAGSALADVEADMATARLLSPVLIEWPFGLDQVGALSAPVSKVLADLVWSLLHYQPDLIPAKVEDMLTVYVGLADLEQATGYKRADTFYLQLVRPLVAILNGLSVFHGVLNTVSDRNLRIDDLLTHR